jgi:hypothetical protein
LPHYRRCPLAAESEHPYLIGIGKDQRGYGNSVDTALKIQI